MGAATMDPYGLPSGAYTGSPPLPWGAGGQYGFAPPPQGPTGPWWGGGMGGGMPAYPWDAGTQPPDWQRFYGTAAGGGPEAQGWMNVLLPWYQQAQQEQQFRAQLQHLQWQQQGSWVQQQQQQQQQLAYQQWAQSGGWGHETQQQERQLEYQRWLASGGWEQERERQEAQFGQQRWAQTGEWEQQQVLQEKQLAARETESAYEAFGRRWRPNTRWT